MYGERLREIREEEFITQIKVAKDIGISTTSYCKYEKEVEIIPLKHLIKIVNYFNVSFDYVFGFTTKKQYININKDIDIKKSGERLREFRKEINCTQNELAEKLHIARSIIGKYEKGQYLVATHTLYSICKKYRISADYLLGRVDTPKNF